MIISIAGQRNGDSQKIIAGLIAQRLRVERKLMLLDLSGGKAEPCRQAGAISNKIEELLVRHNDVVIDITGCAAEIGRPALISAQLAIVLLHVEEARLDKDYRLISQLNAARMFNPGLHVLFAVIAGQGNPSSAEIAAVRAYCAEVMSAKLCPTMIESGAAISTGVESLYKKVFEQHPARSGCALH
jgi:chromosome partitioning protein